MFCKLQGRIRQRWGLLCIRGGGDDKDRILFLVGLLLTVCDAHRMATTKSSGVKVRII